MEKSIQLSLKICNICADLKMRPYHLGKKRKLNLIDELLTQKIEDLRMNEHMNFILASGMGMDRIPYKHGIYFYEYAKIENYDVC